jgi:hypothetical protein
MTPIGKLAKLALDHPELRADLMPLLQRYKRGAAMEITGPPTTDIYEKKVDHGYDQALAGGHDIMKRLQDRLLIEQGREPRDSNPRLAASVNLQRGLITLFTSAQGRKVVQDVITKYASETGTTIVVNAAVDEVIENAVAVALDPRRLGRVIAKHTAKEMS